MTGERHYNCDVPGKHVTAEFLGTEQQRDRVKGDRTFKGKYLVKLLDGDQVMAIEFADEASALAVIPGLAAVQRGDALTVPFGVRSAQGYTFYFGRRVAAA